MPAARKVTRKPATKTVAKPAAKRVSKTAAKSTGRKPAAKASTTKAATNAYAEMNVPAIVKMLKAGETMTTVRARYGQGAKIRKALAEAGYNTKGEKVEISEIKGSGAVLAKRVAAQREAGVAWWSLELATGKSETVLRELLNDHGYSALAAGRVVQEREAPAPRPRKAAAKPAAKSTARKTAPKAKATTSAAKRRPARRVKRANP
jgi:hypothetical protein